IEKIADNVNDHKPGERVVAHHHVPCYQCAYCSKGNYTLCSEFKRTNIDPCGFAEYFRVPQYNVSRGAVIPLPPELSFEEGAMIARASCCIRAIRRANIKQGDNVLVVGLGPTGLSQIQLLRHATTGKIIARDIVEARLRLGKKLGADDTIYALEQDVQAHIGNITKDAVDLPIVTTANDKSLSQAFS